MLRYRRSLGRAAALALGVAVFVAMTSVAAQAQVFYINLSPAPPAPVQFTPVQTCSTVYFMNDDGTFGSYLSCSPSYTYDYIYFWP